MTDSDAQPGVSASDIVDPPEAVSEELADTALLEEDEADVAGGKKRVVPQWSRIAIGLVLGLAVGVAVILLVNPHVDEDIEQAVLATREPIFLILTLVALGVLLLADAWCLVVLAQVVRPEVPWWRVLGVALEANLVGGATSFGGLEIPYQIVVLRALGLRVSEATSAVMVKGLLHTSVLVVAALAAFIPISGSPITPLQRWILLGVLGFMLVFWLVGTLWARKPLGLSLLPKPIRRRVGSFVEALGAFRAAGWRVMLKVIILTIVYWIGMFSLIPLILLALGYRGALLPIVVGQAVLQVLMPLSPLPGGAGVAEFGYLELIGPSTPGRIRVASLILWRIMTWILPVALGGLAMGLRGIKRK